MRTAIALNCIHLVAKGVVATGWVAIRAVLNVWIRRHHRDDVSLCTSLLPALVGVFSLRRKVVKVVGALVLPEHVP